MVKADVKHNYYADLELPTTCSIDDIKKQYRKLALLYHPDRNAGKEEEFVPKFQAIQTAHEVLGDQAQKAKYDADRRKAGLYPNFRASQPTTGNPTGNPYSASSAYPPPPRRTQPGTWQRPQGFGAAQPSTAQPSSAQPPTPGASPGATPSGADRFSSFGRGAPTARKDPQQDKSNVFRAWQNMNNAQERQSQFQPASRPPPPAPPTPPNRPRPPPRNDTKMPSEEEIRAGMNYRKPPPSFDAPKPPPSTTRPSADASRADKRQSAWSAFQQANAGNPGIRRTGTARTPKKQGFDPNMPGSDERPAGGGNYAHRHRSEDFGASGNGVPFPPPPPGPPPHSPLSTGSSPTSSRPFADPLRPFKSREDLEPQVPFTEGNRKRTPYTGASGVGEKTEFSSDRLRRSASTRDASKLHVGKDGNARARSTSPLGRHQTTKGHAQHDTQRKPFVDYGSSEQSEDEESMEETPEDHPNAASTDHNRRPHSATHTDRPKMVPTPPSTRFNGARSPFAPPQTSDGTQSDADLPDMRQKTSNNMYAFPDPYKHDILNQSPFSPGQWAAQMFGTYPTCMAELQRGHQGVPQWAVPSSVLPARKKEAPRKVEVSCEGDPFVGATDLPAGRNRPSPRRDAEQQCAFSYFCSALERAYGQLPENLDMEIFLKLASTVGRGESSGSGVLDHILKCTLSLYTLDDLMGNVNATYADTQPRADRFTFPNDPNLFTPNNKSRSEENISTDFSKDWNGSFTGSPGYFGAAAQTSARKPTSPLVRGATRSGIRAATMNVPSPSEAETPPPRRSYGSDGQHQQQPESLAGDVKFSKEQWEKTFQDASWTWPPPPPKAPSPVKGGGRTRTPGRKGSKSSATSASYVPPSQPSVVEEPDEVTVEVDDDGNVKSGGPVTDEGDAMDIDSTPPAHQQQQEQAGNATTANNANEARLYSVPPSAWRQQQANGHRKSNSESRRAQRASAGEADAKLNANLDDLAHVEPLAPNAEGLKNLSDLSSTLPFPSQASATLPPHMSHPHRMPSPQVPKAPEPPAKLTKQSWHAYTQAFSAYLQAYHAFNKTMLAHLTAREQQAQARMVGGFAWLEAIGDTSGALSGPSGFGSYFQGVREDEQVRETWNLGCERHVDAVKGFEKTREFVRQRMAAGGGLVEH